MSDVKEMRARLDTLEAHIAHQDQVLEELSDVATKQWSEITALKERLERLNNRFQEMEAGIDDAQEEEPPPPHY